MGNRKNRKGSWINAVIVSHEFTDLMHKETLLEISWTVPVFATERLQRQLGVGIILILWGRWLGLGEIGDSILGEGEFCRIE